MAITLEAVDQVINRTNCTYKEAKAALEKTDGDALEAIILIEEAANAAGTQEAAPEEEDSPLIDGIPADDEIPDPVEAAEHLKERIKKSIAEGNVNKIRVSRGGKELVTVPVNVGVGVGILGIAAAPWAILLSAAAAYGFDCKFEIIRNDGSTEIL